MERNQLSVDDVVILVRAAMDRDEVQGHDSIATAAGAEALLSAVRDEAANRLHGRPLATVHYLGPGSGASERSTWCGLPHDRPGELSSTRVSEVTCAACETAMQAHAFRTHATGEHMSGIALELSGRVRPSRVGRLAAMQLEAAAREGAEEREASEKAEAERVREMVWRQAFTASLGFNPNAEELADVTDEETERLGPNFERVKWAAEVADLALVEWAKRWQR